MKHGGGDNGEEKHKNGAVCYCPCKWLLQIGFKIKENRRYKQIAYYFYGKQAYCYIEDPQVQKTAERLRYHIQSPEKTEQSEAQIFIIDFLVSFI